MFFIYYTLCNCAVRKNINSYLSQPEITNILNHKAANTGISVRIVVIRL